MSPNKIAFIHENFTIKTSCLRDNFVLLLILLTFFASYPSVFAQGLGAQNNDGALPLSGLSSEEEPAFRSVSHPFSQSTEDENASPKVIQRPLIPVASSGKFVWGSERVNQIICSIITPETTWLGTGFGLKRLDNFAKTVRHYTTLDGLPYNWVKSLGSYEGEIYCSTQNEIPRDRESGRSGFANYQPSIKLSRFDAIKDRWETVAENTFASSRFQCVIENGMSLVVATGEPGKLIALVTPMKGGTSQSIVCPSFAAKPFLISFAHVDVGNLWLGSALGLLHYDFKSKEWELLLPDRLVAGGCADTDGSLWLTTKKSEPFNSDGIGNEISVFRWDITHYTSGKPPKHIPLYNDKEYRHSRSAVFSTILIAEKKIWTIESKLSDISYTLSGSHLPAIYSYDALSHETKVETNYNSSYESYDKIPFSILASESRRFVTSEYKASLRRFAGWLCASEDDEKSEHASSSPPNVDYDRHWKIEGGEIDQEDGSISKPVLTRLSKEKKSIESFPFPTFMIHTHEPVSSPVKIASKVYFISYANNFRLYCWDLKSNTMSPKPELDTVLSYRKSSGMSYYEWKKLSHFKIIADGASIWIGTGIEVVKYDTRRKKFFVWKTPAGRYVGAPSPFLMMSASKGKAWVHGARNELLMAGDETSSDLKIFKMPEFERGDYRNEPSLFSVEEGIAWFKSASSTPPIQTKVFGYDLHSKEWTSSFISTSPAFNQPLSYGGWKQGSIRWFNTNQSAIGYSNKTGEWISLPPLPSELRTPYLMLLSIDDNNAWSMTPYVDYARAGKITIQHLDRKRNSWSKMEINLGKSMEGSFPGVMFDNVLFAPSDIGLWTYDFKSKKKTQSPPLEASAAAIGFEVRAWDKNAVWLIGQRPLNKTILKFDLNTKSWKSFTEFGSMSTDQWRGNFVADGESLWLGTSKDEYHWNTKSEIWEKVADKIGEIESGTTFRKVAPDGDNVWLLPEINDYGKPPSAKNGFQIELKRLEIPLYRYHIPSHSYFPVQLVTKEPTLPYNLTVSKKGALLTTNRGCFRYDRKTESWQKLSVPNLPEGFPPTHAWTAYEDEKSYWFVNGYSGNDLGDVLQWKK